MQQRTRLAVIPTRPLLLQLSGLFCILALLLSACGSPAVTVQTATPAAPTPTASKATPAAPTPAANGKTQQYKVQGNAASVLKYWTQDKMAKAISFDTLVKDVKQFQQTASTVIKHNPTVANLKLPTRQLPAIPNMSPQDLQDLLKQLAQLAQQASSGRSDSPFASALNSFSLLNTTRPALAYSYPLSTVGKVFFSDGGHNYVCSGAAVNTENKSVVDTAGHCIYDNGHWMSNWIFCPMYYSGSAPYGCWTANYLEVDGTWANSGTITSSGEFEGDFAHDYGMAVMHPSARYGYLTDSVGGLGYLYDANSAEQFYAYGYPAETPYNGASMKSCNGGDQVWNNGNGNYMLSISCGMTGGSSGGPWIINYNGGWYLNGHNDMKAYAYPDSMYSPYYGDEWYSVFSKAASADPGGPV